MSHKETPEAIASYPAPVNASLPLDAQIAAEQNEEAGKILNSYIGKAKRIALQAQHNRVSRRLMLAERAKKLTIVCQETGIVSLLDVPAIPGFAAEFLHPLSILSNARGLAQRGKEYLQKLDTQTLAGILLTIQSPYELFRFRPFDSGAEKNAILRTGGKDLLIDAIILIENFVHSRNRQFLPSASFVIDFHDDNMGVDIRLSAFLRHLAESIAKPDTSVYDENAKPKKIGRPVYIRDVEKQERRLSYLARQEIAAARKEFDVDKKEAKKLIATLFNDGKVDAKGRAVLLQLFGDDALLTLENENKALLCMKLAAKEHAAGDKLIEIVKKDRKVLSLDISEIEDMIEEEESQEIEEEILGEAIPQAPNDSEQEEEIASDEMISEVSEVQEPQEQLQVPEGLSPIQQILWKKKNMAAIRNVRQNLVEVGTTYTPSTTKENLGRE